jgi:hypothetical protein
VPGKVLSSRFRLRLGLSALVVTCAVLSGRASASSFTVAEHDWKDNGAHSNLIWLDMGVATSHRSQDGSVHLLAASQPFAGYRYTTGSNVFDAFIDTHASALVRQDWDPGIVYLIDLLEPIRLTSDSFTSSQRRTERGHLSDPVLLSGHPFDFVGGYSGSQGGAASGGGGAGGGGGGIALASAIMPDDAGPSVVLPTPLPASLALFSGAVALLGFLRFARSAKATVN